MLSIAGSLCLWRVWEAHQPPFWCCREKSSREESSKHVDLAKPNGGGYKSPDHTLPQTHVVKPVPSPQHVPKKADPSPVVKNVDLLGLETAPKPAPASPRKSAPAPAPKLSDAAPKATTPQKPQPVPSASSPSKSSTSAASPSKTATVKQVVVSETGSNDDDDDDSVKADTNKERSMSSSSSNNGLSKSKSKRKKKVRSLCLLCAICLSPIDLTMHLVCISS